MFLSGSTVLHSYQQRKSNPVSLCPHQHLVVSLFFYFSHFGSYIVISHCGLNLVMANSVLICYSYTLFGEMIVHDFCSFSNLIDYYYCIWFGEFFINSRYKFYVRYMVSYIFSQSVACLLFFSHGFWQSKHF